MTAPDHGWTNIHILLEPETEEVSIATRGATVVLHGVDAVRMVRDRLSRLLITMAEYSDVPRPPVEDPDPRLRSQPIPGPGAGGSV